MFEYDLVADPGYLVSLASFSMATWGAVGYTINWVRVLDGGGNTLFNDANSYITGAGSPAHAHFGQSSVPEPAALPLLILGGLLLVYRRRV